MEQSGKLLLAYQANGPASGAVADFGGSQRSAIPGGRGSCRAVRFRSSAEAPQEARPPRLTIIRDYTRGNAETAGLDGWRQVSSVPLLDFGGIRQEATAAHEHAVVTR